MTGNLGMLAFFKYYMFTMENVNSLLSLLGLGESYFRVLQVTLPIGISFYTFQTMSYTIDVWRGDAPPVKDLRTFSCFVSLFPQLGAGNGQVTATAQGFHDNLYIDRAVGAGGKTESLIGLVKQEAGPDFFDGD